jgi:uncharacterized protein YkwD
MPSTDGTVVRRTRRLTAGLILVLALGAATADARGASCAGAGRIPRAATLGEAAVATLCVVNGERAQHHLRPLRSHPALERAAHRFAGEMVRGRFFSHTSPSGSSLGSRLRAVGYAVPGVTWSIGEALACGFRSRATPEATVAAWLASPPHRRLLLDPRFRDAGIGVAAGAPVGPGGHALAATYALDLGARG